MTVTETCLTVKASEPLMCPGLHDCFLQLLPCYTQAAREEDLAGWDISLSTHVLQLFCINENSLAKSTILNFVNLGGQQETKV